MRAPHTQVICLRNIASAYIDGQAVLDELAMDILTNLFWRKLEI